MMILCVKKNSIFQKNFFEKKTYRLFGCLAVVDDLVINISIFIEKNLNWKKNSSKRIGHSKKPKINEIRKSEFICRFFPLKIFNSNSVTMKRIDMKKRGKFFYYSLPKYSLSKFHNRKKKTSFSFSLFACLFMTESFVINTSE